MKKLLAVIVLLLSVAKAHAGGNVATDLFPYENRHSTFTVDVDASRIQRMSIQVVVTTPAIIDAPFTNTAVDTTNDTFYLPSHGYATALPVLLSTAGTTAPSPLTTGTTYFAVKITDNLIKVATTYALALTGDAIDILSVSSGAWTFRPVALSAGSAGYTFSSSNDGVNWTVTTSSQSLAPVVGGTSARLFDWGEYAYKWLRFTFNGPTAGVMKVRAYLYGKEN